MKKTKWRSRAPPRSICFNSPHNYLCLHNKDSLYTQNLSLLKQPQFQCVIRTLTKDIRFLLVMNTQQFFKELKDNKSLSKSLESCLIMFPRRRYSKLQKGKPSQRETIQPPDQSYQCYKLLVQAVLFVYYRISKAPSEYKQLVYDEWLLDIPKLLDIAAVYGQSNQSIVKQIIANAYKTNSFYDDDTLSFFNLVQKDKLDQMELQRGSNISFTPESLSAKHYANQEQYMVQQTIKLIFTIKDILFNLTNFLKFFPNKYVFEFAADFKIQERLVDGVTHFMKQSSEDWKLGERAVLFENHFEDLRQSMAVYFIMEFNLLKQILSSNEQTLKDLHEGAEDTYLTFCLLLSHAHKKPHHQYYQNLINSLIQESEEPIFFSWPQKNTKINEKSRRAIEKSIEYEKHYRKHKKNVSHQTNDLDAVFNRYRKNLKKYKQINQNAPTPLQQKIKEKYEQQRRKREMQPDLCLQINSLKYKYNRQYDDDPEEELQFHRIRLKNDHDYFQKIIPKPELNLSFEMKKQNNNHNHSIQDMSFETINFTRDNDSNQSFSGLYQPDLNLNISSISFVVDQGDSLKQQPILNFLEIPELIETDMMFKKNINKADQNVDIALHLENEKDAANLQEFQQFLQQQSYKCDIFEDSNNMSFNIDSDQ